MDTSEGAAKKDSAPMDTSGDKEPKSKEPDKPKYKIKTNRIDLKVAAQMTGGVTNKAIQDMFDKEVQMAAQDKLIGETNDARNQLESYVLEMRTKLNGELHDFIKHNDREKFLTTLQNTEDWLNGDGSDAQKSDYKKKIDELKAVGDKIEYRKYENKHRLEFISNLKKSISHYESLINTKEEKYAHIVEEERKKVAMECKTIEQWLASELLKQEQSPIAEDPILTIQSLTKKKDDFVNFSSQIFNKPKPEPPKPKEEPKKEEPKPAAAGPTAGATTGTGPTPAAGATPGSDAKDPTKDNNNK